MQSAGFILLCFALQQLLGLADSALPLPPYIKPCLRNDPNLNECAKKNGNDAIPYLVKGDPKYKIPELDPLRVEKLRIEQGTKGVKLDLNATDMLIKGLKNFVLEEFNMNFENGITKVRARIPSMVLDSKYTIDGEVHGLPIKGNGDLHVTLEEYEPTIIYRVVLVVRNGEKFIDMHPTSFQATNKNGTIRLTNLYDGDKVLGNNMNTFMNENWKDMYAELEPAIDEVVQKIMDVILSASMEQVPYDQIFPEKMESQPVVQKKLAEAEGEGANKTIASPHSSHIA